MEYTWWSTQYSGWYSLWTYNSQSLGAKKWNLTTQWRLIAWKIMVKAPFGHQSQAPYTLSRQCLDVSLSPPPPRRMASSIESAYSQASTHSSCAAFNSIVSKILIEFTRWSLFQTQAQTPYNLEQKLLRLSIRYFFKLTPSPFCICMHLFAFAR